MATPAETIPSAVIPASLPRNVLPRDLSPDLTVRLGLAGTQVSQSCQGSERICFQALTSKLRSVRSILPSPHLLQNPSGSGKTETAVAVTKVSRGRGRGTRQGHEGKPRCRQEAGGRGEAGFGLEGGFHGDTGSAVVSVRGWPSSGYLSLG